MKKNLFEDRLYEAIAKLIRPVKSPFWGQSHALSSSNPLGVGFVECTVAALLPLATVPKIIDFSRQSSFAIASSKKTDGDFILGSLLVRTGAFYEFPPASISQLNNDFQ